MSRFRLVSFDLCPFVQRSTIALEEKGVAYDVEYIDLSAKPDWFLAISPHGRVPVLEVGGTALFESGAILEYLDETVEPRLHPADPLERARDRAWFSFSDAGNGAVYRMMVAADRATLEAEGAKLNRSLQQLSAELVGPLWRGEQFSAVDAVMYPVLQRAAWLDALYPELGLWDGAAPAREWEAALHDRPSIVASTVPDIHERFLASLPAYGAVHRQDAAQ